VGGACERASKEAKGTRLFGKSPVITLNVNGVSVEAMADSGAEVSLVTEEWYINHLLPGRVVLHEANWQITDASGTAIPCLGYVLVDLEVEGKVIRKCGLFVKRTVKAGGVVQGTQLPLLLGMNVLAELVKEWRSSVKEGSSGELGEKWSKCVRAVEAKLRVMQQPLGWAVVQQGQDLVIPAGTRKIMSVFVPRLQQVDSESVMLEPLENGDGYWVPEGICVLPSYSRMKRGRGWIAVANVGKVNVKFRPQ